MIIYIRYFFFIHFITNEVLAQMFVSTTSKNITPEIDTTQRKIRCKNIFWSLRVWLNSSYVANGNMKSPSTVNTFSSILLQKKKIERMPLIIFTNYQYQSAVYEWKSDLHVHVLIRNYKKDFKMNFFKPPFSNFEIVFLHVSSNNWFRRVSDAKKYFWGY